MRKIGAESKNENLHMGLLVKLDSGRELFGVHCMYSTDTAERERGVSPVTLLLSSFDLSVPRENGEKDVWNSL